MGINMKKQSAPTMKDVAREAGVALGTVSKVINGLPVGEEYRLKVENAIHKLNYEVNMYARGLKVQRSNIITLIIPDALNPFFASFAHYVEYALYEQGFRMVLCCANGIPEKEIAYLTMASQNQSDGVIALTYSDIGSHLLGNLPMVTFDRLFENSFIPRVASDNYNGAIAATEKLLELGCKRPAFIRFSSQFPGEADKRIDGYLKVCSDHKIEPVILDKRDYDDYSSCIYHFVTSQRSSSGSLTFDGVFSNTDSHACLMHQILTDLHYRVPEDIQIIGFDGIRQFGDPAGKLFVSSMCQPVKELAETCVELVLAQERSTLPSLTLLPVRYQPGGTTKDSA